jgi:hypothetical protein
MNAEPILIIEKDLTQFEKKGQKRLAGTWQTFGFLVTFAYLYFTFCARTLLKNAIAVPTKFIYT